VVRVRVTTKGTLAATKAALSVSNPEIQRGLRQAVSVYAAAMRRRFDAYSRGGGDWTPLALVTTERRRRGGKKKGGVDFGGGRRVR